MTTDFDWQVEEEGTNWDSQELVPQRDRTGCWRALILIAGLLLLGGAVALVFRQVDSRVAQAETKLEDDVLALQWLIERLAQQPDDELFRSLLSGRDQDWAEVQSRLLLSHRLFDRPVFDLRLLPEAASYQITFSPDLASAEVVARRRYSTALVEGNDQPVTLAQTSIFRKGEQRWLFSPPLHDFWGEWQTQQEGVLTVVFPARDHDIALRLAADLDAKIAEMCRAMPGIHCPQAWRVWLRFETDPNALLEVADLEKLIRSEMRVELPAPTLVGLPTEELSYQALLRGYGSRLFSALIPELVGYECCERGLFFRALLDKQLSQLDLQPWPLAQTEYDWLLRRPFRWTNVYPHWNNDSLQLGENWQQVYSLIDFMDIRTGSPPPLAQMQQALHTVPGRYLSWVGTFLPVEKDIGHFAADWLRFVYSQTTSGQLASPPIPLPDQALQLVCGTGSREPATLYQFDLASLRRNEVFAHRDIFGQISPLSNGDYLIYQRVFDSDRVYSRTMLWRDNKEVLVSEAVKGQFDSRRGLYFAGEDPLGRYSVLMAYGNPGQSDQFQLLDRSRCTELDCQMPSLLGLPLWSPNGSRTLQVDMPSASARHSLYSEQLQALLFLGDEQGQSRRMIGRGNLPFWLGDNRYGYLRFATPDLQGQAEVVVAAPLDPDSLHVLLRPADLLDVIPETERPSQLFILSVRSQPDFGRFLAVTATASPERGGGPAFTFLVELTAEKSGVSAIALKHIGERSANTSFSPSGQWLTIFTTERPGNVIYLFDSASHGSTTIGSNGRWAGWSADGQWVAQRYDDYLTLLAPAHDYQHMIFQDFSECRAIGWAPAMKASQ